MGGPDGDVSCTSPAIRRRAACRWWSPRRRRRTSRRAHQVARPFTAGELVPRRAAAVRESRRSPVARAHRSRQTRDLRGRHRGARRDGYDVAASPTQGRRSRPPSCARRTCGDDAVAQWWREEAGVALARSLATTFREPRGSSCSPATAHTPTPCAPPPTSRSSSARSTPPPSPNVSARPRPPPPLLRGQTARIWHLAIFLISGRVPLIAAGQLVASRSTKRSPHAIGTAERFAHPIRVDVVVDGRVPAPRGRDARSQRSRSPHRSGGADAHRHHRAPHPLIDTKTPSSSCGAGRAVDGVPRRGHAVAVELDLSRPSGPLETLRKRKRVGPRRRLTRRDLTPVTQCQRNSRAFREPCKNSA